MDLAERLSELGYELPPPPALNLLTDVFGDQGGHIRTALGVASLPANGLVELELAVRCHGEPVRTDDSGAVQGAQSRRTDPAVPVGGRCAQLIELVVTDRVLLRGNEMTALSNLAPRPAQATTKEPAIAFARGSEGHGKCCCADIYTRVGTAC